MAKNIIITGATGMIGGLILQECLGVFTGAVLSDEFRSKSGPFPGRRWA